LLYRPFIHRSGGREEDFDGQAAVEEMVERRHDRRARSVSVERRGRRGFGSHDITSGNNTWNGVTGHSAGAGCDAATGLGTPDVANLVTARAST
jgi:hypothetical protein